MWRQSGTAILSVLLGLTVLSACGNGSSGSNSGNGAGNGGTGSDKPAAEQKHDPVTLTFGTNQGGYNEDVFNTYVKKPIEAKFPYITMSYVNTNNGGDLEKLIAAGETPDILNGGGRGLAGLKQLQLAEDLTPYIKKFNLNLSSLNQAGVDSVKTYSEGGKMLALPYLINFYVMLYNQDIFDKFAVPYPKDNMSWEDVKQLAERVTRQADGTQYKGILPGQVTLMARGMSLSYVDPKTNKAAINTSQWKNLFELALSMYQIPGNMPKSKQLFNLDEFYKDKVLAMLPTYSVQINRIAEMGDKAGFRWDMTSYPSFEAGKSNEVDANILAVTTASKHKDDAFQVIQYLTSSQETQSVLARSGQMPALNMSDFLEQFGADYPILKQKNVKGVFKVETRTPHPFNTYDDVVLKVVNQVFNNQYMGGGLDANTALRQIEDQANKDIQAAMQQ